jgi:hypothetical protein
MPALLAIPWLVPLITGIGAATSLGTTAYQLSQGGGGSSSNNQQQEALQKQQQTQQAAAQKAQQLAAVRAQQGNTQASTGGSLTPNAFLATSAKNAGAPSDLNSIMQYLGGSGASSAPLSGGTTTPNSNQPQDNNLQQLSDLLKAA